LEDYATLGIPEYWIADYAAIGGIHYLGQPKQPTLSIHTHVTIDHTRANIDHRGVIAKHTPVFRMRLMVIEIYIDKTLSAMEGKGPKLLNSPQSSVEWETVSLGKVERK
jgi:hypothetical protein